MRLLRIGSVGNFVVMFLGRYWGHKEHWARKRSEPCLGPSCPPGRHSLRTVYYAYAPAEVWDGASNLWSPVVLQISSNLEEVLRGRTLRGEMWFLRREVEGDRNSALTGHLLENADPSSLLAEFDIRPVLERVMGEAGLCLDVTNDRPGRIILPTTQRPGPDLSRFTAAPADPPPLDEDVRRRLRAMANGRFGKQP